MKNYVEKAFLGVGIGAVLALLWWAFISNSEMMQICDNEDVAVIAFAAVIAVAVAFAAAAVAFAAVAFATVAFAVAVAVEISALLAVYIFFIFLIFAFIECYLFNEVEEKRLEKEYYATTMVVVVCFAIGITSGLSITGYKSYRNIAELEAITFHEDGEILTVDILLPAEGNWIASHLYYAQPGEAESGEEIINRLPITSEIIVSGTVGNPKYKLAIRKEPHPLYIFSYNKKKEVKIQCCSEQL